MQSHQFVSKNLRILLANSNQWYFNKLVKIPFHKTPYRRPHRLNLSSQSSRSCTEPNIKLLKDKDLEFANSICGFSRQRPALTIYSVCIAGCGVLTASRGRGITSPSWHPVSAENGYGTKFLKTPV